MYIGLPAAAVVAGYRSAMIPSERSRCRIFSLPLYPFPGTPSAGNAHRDWHVRTLGVTRAAVSEIFGEYFTAPEALDRTVRQV